MKISEFAFENIVFVTLTLVVLSELSLPALKLLLVVCNVIPCTYFDYRRHYIV